MPPAHFQSPSQAAPSPPNYRPSSPYMGVSFLGRKSRECRRTFLSFFLATPSLPLSLSHTHTHTHTLHIYIACNLSSHFHSYLYCLSLREIIVIRHSVTPLTFFLSFSLLLSPPPLSSFSRPLSAALPLSLSLSLSL